MAELTLADAVEELRRITEYLEQLASQAEGEGNDNA